ncbi:hypothetical protein LX32DRAFT_27015 [Colletotrichum zoysiae]|uniref:Uncharacterized protein n=1 Tax=Colletotrichum zoysiae TaxID=1216348 RepID=A0AAD9HS24_9PEZI|nr:hypothetical protein LX32DRAFT_27015 [Colletotrichum zoysiae]
MRHHRYHDYQPTNNTKTSLFTHDYLFVPMYRRPDIATTGFISCCAPDQSNRLGHTRIVLQRPLARHPHVGMVSAPTKVFTASLPSPSLLDNERPAGLRLPLEWRLHKSREALPHRCWCVSETSPSDGGERATIGQRACRPYIGSTLAQLYEFAHRASLHGQHYE